MHTIEFRRAFTILELLIVIVVIVLLTAIPLANASKTQDRSRRLGCLNNLKQLGRGSLMYAEEDSQGRLTGSLKADNLVAADDDLNWLYGFGDSSKAIVPDLKTFCCPSTKNSVRSNKKVPLFYNGTTLNILEDLYNNASSSTQPFGHSYEVLGVRGIPPVRKTSRSVLSYTKKNNPLIGTVIGPAQTFIMMDAMDSNGIPGALNNYPQPFYAHGQDGGNMSFADGHSEWIPKENWWYRWELSQDAGHQITPLN